MQIPSQKWLKRFAVVGLIVLALTVWLKLLNFGFVDWDDRENLFQNPMFFPGIDWHRIWTSFELESYYPLTLSFWAVLKSIFGMQAFVFHFASLLVHGLNIVLVWSLLTRLFRREEKAEFLILFLTGLFALHPLQVETVAWATEMKSLLCSFFILGSLNLYLLWRESERKIFFASSLVFAAFAFLAKPLAITLPVWILAFEIWRGEKIRWKAWLPFAVLAAGGAMTEMLAQNTSQALQSQGFSFYHPLSSIVFYTSRFFVPQGLAVFYDPRVMILEFKDFAIALVFWILVLGVFFLSEQKERRRLFAAALIFIGGLFPVLGFIPFGALSRFNDRYCYLPLIGLGLLFAFVVRGIYFRVFRFHKFFVALSLFWILLISAVTFQQIDVWENSGTLWQNVISFYPKTAKAHLNLGLSRAENQKYEEAAQEFQTALKLDPDCYRCRTNMAVVLANSGQVSAAIQLNVQALQIQPKDLSVISNVANLYAQLGNSSEAKKYLKMGMDIDPHFPQLKTLEKSLSTENKKAAH